MNQQEHPEDPMDIPLTPEEREQNPVDPKRLWSMFLINKVREALMTPGDLKAKTSAASWRDHARAWWLSPSEEIKRERMWVIEVACGLDPVVVTNYVRSCIEQDVKYNELRGWKALNYKYDDDGNN